MEQTRHVQDQPFIAKGAEMHHRKEYRTILQLLFCDP